jgi:hypothetical protein
MVEPGGIAFGDGCGPGRRLASRSSQSSFGALGVVVMSCAPAGLTGAGAIVTVGGGVDVEAALHPATAMTMASKTVATRVLIGTP